MTLDGEALLVGHAVEHEAAWVDGLDVGRPEVDQRDVVPGLGQVADVPAERPDADHGDSLAHVCSVPPRLPSAGHRHRDAARLRRAAP
ncbi:MAG: hypothetical protein R2755_08855 [Acidimicrobiales bacterium]